jgi:hypothetical protein
MKSRRIKLTPGPGSLKLVVGLRLESWSFHFPIQDLLNPIPSYYTQDQLGFDEVMLPSLCS